MKHIRQHWRITLIAVWGIVISGGVSWWLSGNNVVMADPPDYTPVTETERDTILGVARHIGLDRATLSALNVTDEQAESVVSAVRDWHEDNAASLAALQATIDQRLLSLRRLKKAINRVPGRAVTLQSANAG